MSTETETKNPQEKYIYRRYETGAEDYVQLPVDLSFIPSMNETQIAGSYDVSNILDKMAEYPVLRVYGLYTRITYAPISIDISSPKPETIIKAMHVLKIPDSYSETIKNIWDEIEGYKVFKAKISSKEIKLEIGKDYEKEFEMRMQSCMSLIDLDKEKAKERCFEVALDEITDLWADDRRFLDGIMEKYGFEKNECGWEETLVSCVYTLKL